MLATSLNDFSDKPHTLTLSLLSPTPRSCPVTFHFPLLPFSLVPAHLPSFPSGRQIKDHRTSPLFLCIPTCLPRTFLSSLPSDQGLQNLTPLPMYSHVPSPYLPLLPAVRSRITSRQSPSTQASTWQPLLEGCQSRSSSACSDTGPTSWWALLDACGSSCPAGRNTWCR